MSSSEALVFGVCTVFASYEHGGLDSYTEVDTTRNGTWASAQILGRFRTLASLRHRNICSYVDIIRCKHDRLMIITEHHSKCLLEVPSKEFSFGAWNSCSFPVQLVANVLHGLDYLVSRQIGLPGLTPEMIVVDERGSNFKIRDFGSVYLSDYGTLSPLQLRDPRYCPPEVLTLGAETTGILFQTAVSDSSAVWSLALILLSVLQCISPSTVPVKTWVTKMLTTIETSFLEALESMDEFQKYTEMTESVRGVLERWLLLDCDDRPTPKIALETFGEAVRHKFEQAVPEPYDPLWGRFPPVELRCRNETRFDKEFMRSPLLSRNTDEIYSLWKLAGGDVVSEVKAHGYAKEEPPVFSVPQIVTGDQKMLGASPNPHRDPSGNLITLNVEPLFDKLYDVPKELYFPLLLRSNDAELSAIDYSTLSKLPLAIRETNLKYQLYRQILFHRLLLCYPYTTATIRKEAALDIPPLYRSRVWAALLEVQGDIAEKYDSIDKDSPCVSDRQIDVDIPRCHQYDAIMTSAVAHWKLRRILKAWIADHPQFVYWQGLDSLTTPLMYVNFHDEALAYACLTAFVRKYVYSFFLKDNTPVIQEYLAVFSHLLAFHDPVLSSHLTTIGFFPELYAIPWFLTMFTHVFPLHKIFHLWDQLLLGDESFPLFVGLSLLHQLRDRLLGNGFNEILLIFSDFPDLDIQLCLQRAKEMFTITPKSVTCRRYASENMNHTEPTALSSSGNRQAVPTGVYEIDLETLKTEISPRITWQEIHWLLNPGGGSNGTSHKRAPRPILVDVRLQEEFLKGTFPHSMNIPFTSAFDADGKLLSSFESRTLEDSKGKLVVVLDGKCNYSPTFAAKLVQLGFPHVCVLHQGIDHLKTSGYVTVPNSW
ncbi:hypothetical protein RvY_02702-2 [Ramazzottius varieornatus]|uniref:TBC domain-containing protein kinase-like protein n=1 Tax=Ramazzottius varieornatus TaxID=947166 RepID=A0A1D1UP19_RAMVA|nr:hypothetical protein RvY_02702-2 [Ramazzottius varieornatus]